MNKDEITKTDNLNNIITKTVSFHSLLKSTATLFFVDIEGTLLAPNLYYDFIGHKDFGKLFLSICSDVHICDAMYFGKNFRRQLMEENLVDIIKELQNNKKSVFALTSGFPSRQKRDRVEGLGISFNGYLFTRGNEKGPFLINFLTMNNINGDCCFIDNHLSKLENVQRHFMEYFHHNRFIDLFFYDRQYKETVLKEKFVNYWEAVVQAIKNGELQILRESIQKRQRKKSFYKSIDAE